MKKCNLLLSLIILILFISNLYFFLLSNIKNNKIQENNKATKEFFHELVLNDSLEVNSIYDVKYIVDTIVKYNEFEKSLLLIIPNNSCLTCIKDRVMEIINLTNQTRVELYIICEENIFRDLSIQKENIHIVENSYFGATKIFNIPRNKLFYIYLDSKSSIYYSFIESTLTNIPELIIKNYHEQKN